MSSMTRRQFVSAGVSVSVASTFTRATFAAASSFKVGVISDEISQDFDHACSVIAHDFGLHYVELREIWAKNLQQSSDTELADAEKILAKYGLQVTGHREPAVQSELARCSGCRNTALRATRTAQPIPITKNRTRCWSARWRWPNASRRTRVRCFDFWRLDDVKPYRAAINQRVRQAADVAAKQNNSARARK